MTITINPIGTYATGIFDQSAAEIVAHDPETQRLFVVNANQVIVEVLDISDPTNPTKIAEIDSSDFGGVANSVAVANGLMVVAIEDENSQQPGRIAFFETDATEFDQPLNVLQVGALPDAVTFTKDGNKVVVANEGEPDPSYQIDPEGSISIIDISQGVEGLQDSDVQTAGFEQFNELKEELIASGVRIFGPNASVAQDLEPEYIAVSSDSSTAYVTLQENNALAVVDLETATVLDILPLGFKDHSLENPLDVSDRDGEINISNWPIFGMYQPDSIASFTIDGEDFLITANEGDARAYDGFDEESRVAGLLLNPEAFPNAAELQQEENLGRLRVTNALGDDNGDGQFERLYSFGARSFSIWNTEGNLIFDSGDRFEQDIARTIPDFFNSNHTDNDSFDSRSDDKGPEPEGVAVGVVDGETYAFIGLERIGGVMIYNISDPSNPQFEDYVNNRNFVDADGEFIPTSLPDGSTNPETGDLGAEGVIFISAEDSPNGEPLVVVTNEVSGTTTLFAVEQLGTEPDLPSLVFGTPEADSFDSALPDERNFIGDGQTLFTGSGDDTVDVALAVGGNRIDLGSGNDTLFAGSNNRIIAGPGNDILFLGNGSGNNVVTGDMGADQFWIVTDTGALATNNTITDFTPGEDVIGLANTDLSFADLTLSEEVVSGQTRTTITALAEPLAVLLNIQATALNEANFVFA